ncbi:MAG TPA: VOC family protein [Bacillota bacterium]|nr:VOC family protein [Bacillota bacterium]
MSNFHNPDVPHISHVTLRVLSVSNSAKFYSEVLGLTILNIDEDRAILVGAYGHLITLVKADKGHSFTEGLYHVAFILPSIDDLAQWFLYQRKRHFIIYGASDHLVSKAFYFNDPDGNGIEIYADSDPSSWKESRQGIHMDTLPLDIDQLISGHIAPEKLSGEVKIGHLHLKTKDVSKMQDFYRLLGFGVTLNMSSAVFMSFMHYHHHIAFNQWNKFDMAIHRDDDVDINDFTIQYPNEEILGETVGRLIENGLTLFNQDEQAFVYDPMNIKVNLSVYQLLQ